MAEEEPLHVIIRVPFKRPQGFVEPPPIVWTEAMEHQLWKALSQNKRASLDWNLIARQMNVPAPYLIRHAAFLYETQLRGLQQQLQIAKSSSSGRNSSETRHRPPRLMSSTDGRAPAMDRHQLSGSSISGHSGVMAKSRTSATSRSGAEGGDLAPLSPITPRQPYSPRDQPPYTLSAAPQSPRILSASPPAQPPRNSPPTSTPPTSHPRSTTPRSSSSTSLVNLASSSLQLASSLRIRNSPPQHPPLPNYSQGPQRDSPARSPLPPIASTPPLQGRLSTGSLAPGERSRSEATSGRGDGSRYFDVAGSGGRAEREEEGVYHRFGLDDAEKSDGSATGSERSSRSEDEGDEFDEGARRGRRDRDELTFAAEGLGLEAEPAFLPAATATGGGAFATAGGRTQMGLGRGKGVPVPGEMDRNLGMGGGVGHGRMRGGAGGGGGLMSSPQVLARPPTTNSFTSTPRNLQPQPGFANSTPARSAAAVANRSAGRDVMEQVARAQQQVAVQAEAQAQAGSRLAAGDSPTTSAQNSVGGSYSDLDGSVSPSELEDAFLSNFNGSRMSADFSKKY